MHEELKSIRVHLALEKSHNFAMMPPISKLQRPADCALQVGSKYTVYVLLTYTAMEIAVCPISVVRTLFSPQNMPMTYAYALCVVYISANKTSRRAFFARGSGVFHGALNPLSSKSIVEHCVLPCLLFGAETWVLNSALLQKLESFQAELAKRILRLPTCTSNNTARMALQWPSMQARILIIKLCFLLKVVNSDTSLSARVFRSLAASDVDFITR